MLPPPESRQTGRLVPLGKVTGKEEGVPLIARHTLFCTGSHTMAKVANTVCDLVLRPVGPRGRGVQHEGVFVRKPPGGRNAANCGKSE